MTGNFITKIIGSTLRFVIHFHVENLPIYRQKATKKATHKWIAFYLTNLKL